MPDIEMEEKHIESLERIRRRLLALRSKWEERLETRAEAIRMIAELDSSLDVNANLIRLAKEAASSQEKTEGTQGIP